MTRRQEAKRAARRAAITQERHMGALWHARCGARSNRDQRKALACSVTCGLVVGEQHVAQEPGVPSQRGLKARSRTGHPGSSGSPGATPKIPAGSGSFTRRDVRRNAPKVARPGSAGGTMGKLATHTHPKGTTPTRTPCAGLQAPSVGLKAP